MTLPILTIDPSQRKPQKFSLNRRRNHWIDSLTMRRKSLLVKKLHFLRNRYNPYNPNLCAPSELLLSLWRKNASPATSET